MRSLKITTLGIITALKNLGVFLATWVIADIKANPAQFLFMLAIYALISVPSDLYLLNKAHENGKAEQKENTAEAEPDGCS